MLLAVEEKQARLKESCGDVTQALAEALQPEPARAVPVPPTPGHAAEFIRVLGEILDCPSTVAGWLQQIPPSKLATFLGPQLEGRHILALVNGLWHLSVSPPAPSTARTGAIAAFKRLKLLPDAPRFRMQVELLCDADRQRLGRQAVAICENVVPFADGKAAKPELMAVAASFVA